MERFNAATSIVQNYQLAAVTESKNKIALSSQTSINVAMWKPFVVSSESEFNGNHSSLKNVYLGAEVDKLATCIFEGDTYREGQKMYPQNDCYKCVCTSDFDNSTSFEQNQSCKKIDCGISIRNIDRIRVGCIPVYYKQDNCCPIGWRCPGEKHMIESETYKSGVVDGPKCKFGKWELNVGQSLDVEEDSCHNCTCTVPPMLHCLSTC